MFRRLFHIISQPNHRTYARLRPPGAAVNSFAAAHPPVTRHQQQRIDRRLPDDDPTDPGQYEADFNQLAHSHRAHRTEQAAERERIKQRTVGAKYFRTASPNFLTWAEKEQIRRLHAGDPDEWPLERLAAAFPADGETVAKLVRARWTPRNDERIRRHDEAVRAAWQAFDAGDVGDMDATMRAHLQQFGGGRSAVPVKATVPGIAVEKRLPKLDRVKDDFTKILTSCHQFKGIDAGRQSGPPPSAMPPALPSVRSRSASSEENTFLLGKVRETKAMMYHELDEVAEKEPVDRTTPARHAHNPFHDPRRASNNTGQYDDADDVGEHDTDVAVAASSRRQSKFPHPNVSQNDMIVPKYEMTEVQPSDADLRRMSMPAIRDQITIPAKLWRRGATYKLADCYYDDDGEFLYRVPGMTGRDL